MRRLLVTAASGAVLLLGAGCSTDTSGDTAPPAGATTAAAPAPAPAAPGGSAAPEAAPATTEPGGKAGNPGDAALAADTDAICKQAVKVSGETVTAFARESKQLAAAKNSAGRPATDQAAAGVQRRLESWSYALGSLSELTTDAALKKSFGTLSGKVEKLSRAEDPSTVEQSQLRAVQNDVEKACAAR